MAAGLAIVMAQVDMLAPERQREFQSHADLVQESAGKYYSADGGWNFFPDQIRPTEHSAYASVLALLALMETHSAGLPWGGSVARRDEMLRTTANWLIAHFERNRTAGGWREAPADPSLVDGLTLQAYAELLRAEAQVGTHLPDAIHDAIRRQVLVLASRGADYEVLERTYSRQYRGPDGRPLTDQQVIRFAWYPWAIETCAWWIRRLEQTNAPREDLVAARRALGHLVVDLGESTVTVLISGIGFPIAETAYALAILE